MGKGKKNKQQMNLNPASSGDTSRPVNTTKTEKDIEPPLNKDTSAEELESKDYHFKKEKRDESYSSWKKMLGKLLRHLVVITFAFFLELFGSLLNPWLETLWAVHRENVFILILFGTLFHLALLMSGEKGTAVKSIKSPIIHLTLLIGYTIVILLTFHP